MQRMDWALSQKQTSLIDGYVDEIASGGRGWPQLMGEIFRWLEPRPERKKLCLGMIEGFARSRRPEIAQLLAETATSAFPDDPEFWQLCSSFEWVKGRGDDARISERTATKTKKTRIALKRAQGLIARGRGSRAVDVLHMATDWDGASTKVLKVLAQLATSEGRHDLALATWRRLRGREPQMSEFIHGEASSLFSLGRERESFGAYVSTLRTASTYLVKT